MQTIWCKHSIVRCLPAVAGALCLNGTLSDTGAAAIAVDVPASQADGPTLDVGATVRSVRARIRAVDLDKPDPKDPDALYEYWLGLYVDSASEFMNMLQICGPQQEQALRVYWDGFTEGTAQDRMRWFLAGGEYFYPTQNGLPFGDTIPSAVKRQRHAAEIVVRSLLNDPQSVEEYYRGVAWQRGMLRNLNGGGRNWMCFVADCIDEHIHEGADPDYWIYARNFIVVAFATSRIDLLMNTKAEQLGPAFVSWYQWFQENAGYLVASPDKPVWKLDGEARRQRKVNRNWEDNMGLPELKWPVSPFSNWEGVPAYPDGMIPW